SQVSGPADLLADLDLFAEAQRVRMDPDRLRSLGLDVGATHAVDRVRRQLEAKLAPARGRVEDPDTALGMAILAGYPDRVAWRRAPKTVNRPSGCWRRRRSPRERARSSTRRRSIGCSGAGPSCAPACPSWACPRSARPRSMLRSPRCAWARPGSTSCAASGS